MAGPPRLRTLGGFQVQGGFEQMNDLRVQRPPIFFGAVSKPVVKVFGQAEGDSRCRFHRTMVTPPWWYSGVTLTLLGGRVMAKAKQLSAEDRFWLKVDRDGPLLDGSPELGNCWEWTASKQRWGYGKFSIKRGRWIPAHRASYELAYGPIPQGMFILHRCDNPPCVRPSHLRTGTPKENTRDMLDRGRAARLGAEGESNSHAKLTEAQVIRIRRRFAEGELIVHLAAEAGMTVSAISSVVNGRSWRHVGGPTRKPGQIGRRTRKVA